MSLGRYRVRIHASRSTRLRWGLQLIMRKTPKNSPSTHPLNGVNGASSPASSDRQPNSSRGRFDRYREKVRRQTLPKGEIHSSGEARSAKDRVRSATQLVWHYIRLLRP